MDNNREESENIILRIAINTIFLIEMALKVRVTLETNDRSF